jgi:hypothetical protein
MNRYIGVWEKPFYTFEISIGKAKRLLQDSKNFDFSSLIEKFSRKRGGAVSLNLADPLINDLLYSSVYREQALVLCVTSFEIYLRRKRDELIDKKGGTSFPRRIEGLKFQNLDECEEFEKIIGVQIFEGNERKSLDGPFQDRHIIIHNGSLIDVRWAEKLGKAPTIADLRQKIDLSYDFVSNTIQKIYIVIARSEERINQKFNIEDFDLPLILLHYINTFLPNSAILEVFQNPL